MFVIWAILFLTFLLMVFVDAMYQHNAGHEIRNGWYKFMGGLVFLVWFLLTTIIVVMYTFRLLGWMWANLP